MDDLYQKLLESSLRFVSFRPRSEKELCDFLLKNLHKLKSRDNGLVARVVQRLRELGYADDTKFSQWWVSQRGLHKPKGKRAITQELKAKGITAIDLHLDELSLAKEAIVRKLPLWQKLPALEQKKKIYGFLGRRGFDAETIHQIVTSVVESRQ